MTSPFLRESGSGLSEGNHGTSTVLIMFIGSCNSFEPLKICWYLSRESGYCLKNGTCLQNPGLQDILKLAGICWDDLSVP